jgi:hypothetical protein
MLRVRAKIKSTQWAILSGSGVSGWRQSLQGTLGRAGLRSQTVSGAPILPAPMDNYANPYRDDPESLPQTRAGRLIECGVALLLAVLAVYLSR